MNAPTPFIRSLTNIRWFDVAGRRSGPPEKTDERRCHEAEAATSARRGRGLTGTRALGLLAIVTALLLLGTAGLAAASHGPPRNVTALAVDPLTPTTLYAGTSDNGVHKSEDGGVTWIATGLTNSQITAVAVAIDPVTSTTLYAGTSDRGVLKFDGGVTWSATGLNAVVQALMTDPGTPGTLYAVTDTGAFKSTNAGAGWSPIGPANARVQALAIDPLSSTTTTTVYAGVSDGVYQSLDGGLNWAPIGLAGHAVSTLAKLSAQSLRSDAKRHLQNHPRGRLVTHGQDSFRNGPRDANNLVLGHGLGSVQERGRGRDMDRCQHRSD